MKNIAIVEDDNAAAEQLSVFLEKFFTEEPVHAIRFTGSIQFLTNYKGEYDIVFMDIELPDFNGMEAARKLRELDKKVVIIFVTNMAQFAVKGYEVGALDFIVKPVTYSNFALKLKRAVEYLRANEDAKVFVPVDDGFVTLNLSEIRYVEIIKHKIIYHTVHGDYHAYGTLKKIEESLSGRHFVRCNHCYLVNLRYVTSVRGFTAYVGEEALQISHPKRKEFLHALNDYFGGGC